MLELTMDEKCSSCSESTNDSLEFSVGDTLNQNTIQSNTHTSGEMFNSCNLRQLNGNQPYHSKEEEGLDDGAKENNTVGLQLSQKSYSEETCQSQLQDFAEHESASVCSSQEADQLNISGNEETPSIIPTCKCSLATEDNPCAHMSSSETMEEQSNDHFAANDSEAVSLLPPTNVINLTQSVLYPPDSNEPLILSERPLGCKTVFVGGLPDKITEEIIREVFELCGEISVIQMGNQNFCRIRFTKECHADEAVCLSGFKLKISHRDDAIHCSKLYVNYSCSREDIMNIVSAKGK